MMPPERPMILGWYSGFTSTVTLGDQKLVKHTVGRYTVPTHHSVISLQNIVSYIQGRTKDFARGDAHFWLTYPPPGSGSGSGSRF
jgi:hypothetical protein